MQGLLLVVVVVAGLVQSGLGGQPGFLRLSSPNGTETTIGGQISNEENDLFVAKETDAAKLQLVADPLNEFGCNNATGLVPPAGDFALVVDRGNCTFEEKMETALALGARMLIVTNTLDALYNSSTNFLLNACSIDCSVGGEDCKSNLFAKNPRDDPVASECCVVDSSVLSMNLGVYNDNKDVLAVFVGMPNREKLFSFLASGGGQVQIFANNGPVVDGSVFVMLALGTGVVAFASYRAALADRNQAGHLWRTKRKPLTSDNEGASREFEDRDKDIEQVTLDVGSVVCFIIICSLALIGLYFLSKEYPQETVITIQVLFGISAGFAFAHFFLEPVTDRLFGDTRNKTITIRNHTLGTYSQLLATLISFGLVVFWFVKRHASYAWIMLDLLAASICCMFLIAIRLPNLKLSTIMLVIFFLYDIFMVFITPSLFGGESVMVEVATAGQGTAKSSNNECVRTQTERMPMLFMVPNFSDPDRYAMLGLGDIFIPGLLIAYGCRFDYLKARSLGKQTTWWKVHQYFFPLIVAYFFGLLGAYLANIFQLNFSTNVKGQPALLYLVPFTLGTFLFLAWRRGDLHNLWNYWWDDLEPRMLQPQQHREGDEESNGSDGSTDAMITPFNNNNNENDQQQQVAK